MAVRKMLALNPRPDFLITGGDTLEGLLAAEWEQAQRIARLTEEALKPIEMPIHHVVGNHDVFGWARKLSPSSDEPGYGKALFAERMVKGPLTRSMDHKGWHFIYLDSIQFDLNHPRRYEVMLDDAQLEWLKTDLEKTGTKTPIVITTHAPLLSAYHLVNEGAGQPVEIGMTLRNGKAIHEMLTPYNVKLVLQGHTHIREAVTYAGRIHLTSGAVCGNWWSGKRFGIDPEGFTVMDVSATGEVKWQYVETGWNAGA